MCLIVVYSVCAADDAEGGGGAGHQDDGVERGQADLQAGAGRGGARVLGQQADIPAGDRGIRRGAGQRLALPLPGAEERRRCDHFHFIVHLS